MTLPFNVPNKDKRKFQCFVCGVMFQDFLAFKNHIVVEHEEGRDYVLCPLPHCGAPVRDLKLHFKCKHSHTKMPKVAMTKAMIWKDISPKGRKSGKLKTKKPKFKDGWHESSKVAKKLHYRSGYEKTVYECLDLDLDVLTYDAEPFEVPYIHKGKGRKYTPDIIVKFIDGHTEVWEVKPGTQTLLEVNQNKWRAADKACQHRGWQFKVITEKGIDVLKKKVKLQRDEGK